MNVCSRIIGTLGEFWSYIGWGLFLCLTFLPLIPGTTSGQPSAAALFIVLSMPLWLGWLIVDSIDQQVPTWMKVVGILVVILSLGSNIIRIILWVVYWMKVRE